MKYVVLFLALTTLSCDEIFDNKACTLIGCVDGLSVAIPSNAQLPYTVTLQAPGVASVSVQCTSANGCGTNVFFENQTPATVTVTITWQGTTLTKQFTPVYKESQPNGEDCPPVCRQATVSFS
jgi:hypothetical protein